MTAQSPRILLFFFSNGSRSRSVDRTSGFTLLEVMVAVALIAISFVTLIGAQSQSVAIATASKFDIMAALLARQKLTELCLHDYDELNDAAGDFGEEHPEFVWKTEIQELPESGTGIKGSGNMLKSIDLTVSARQDAALSLEVRTLVFKKIAAVK